MKLMLLGGFGKLVAGLAILIDNVFADIDICYEDAYYYYYCRDGKECCKNDTACCDIPTLSAGAIAGIVIGSICGLGLLVFCIAKCCKQSSGHAGVVEHAGYAGQTRVQTIHLQQAPYSYPAYGPTTSYAHPAAPPISHK